MRNLIRKLLEINEKLTKKLTKNLQELKKSESILSHTEYYRMKSLYSRKNVVGCSDRGRLWLDNKREPATTVESAKAL